jgi:hypothetical protein
MKRSLVVLAAVLMLGTAPAAQDSALLLGFRFGDDLVGDDHEYRTVLIQLRGDAMSLSESPRLVIPTSSGFRRVAFATDTTGSSLSEERIVLIGLSDPLPRGRKKKLDPFDDDQHGMCTASERRSIVAAGRRAVMVGVLMTAACGQPNDKTSELLPTVGRSGWANTAASTDALFSLPMAYKADAQRDSLWPKIAASFSGASRAFVAPNRRMVAVLTHSAVVIRTLRGQTIDPDGLSVELRNKYGSRDELVMVEWASDRESVSWSQTLRDRFRRK